MKPIEIIVAGHLCLDMIPDMPNVSPGDLTIPGKLYETGPVRISTGGAVSNTGLALHRQGVRVKLSGTVGDDMTGRMILDYIAGFDPGLAKTIMVKPGQASSSTLVLSPGNIDRTFLHCPGTNITFSQADIDFKQAEQVKIFHLGYPPLLPCLIRNNGRELKDIFQKIKAAGTITSLDMTLPDPNTQAGKADWHTILENTLPFVDIFLPSAEEIIFMLRRADYDAWTPAILPHLDRKYLSELADELLGMGCVITGFKLGEKGMYLKTGSTGSLKRLQRLGLEPAAWADTELRKPAFLVKVAGTTGAGDAAYAGFLQAILKQASPDEALIWACAAGACNVEAADALSGIRTCEETGARIRSGWETRPERLAGF